ncbi:hypothetical protein [Roseivivax sp. CAU 1761]
MERLAYLFEEAELDSVFADWPAGMRVALCLAQDGATQAVLFRSDAPERILERVRQVTGWDDGSFAVVPAMEGAPSLRILYSEAQWFLRLAAEIEDLPRMARDIIDPRPAPAAEAPRPRAIRAGSAPIASSGLLPRRHARARLYPEDGLPEGYRSARELAQAPVEFLAARITTSGRRVRLALEPDAVSERTVPARASPIGYRDDLRAFVLDPAVLADWAPGQGAVIDMPMEEFPKMLAERFARAPHIADVTVTPDGIFVQHGPPEAAAVPLAPPPPSAMPARGWTLRALTVGLIALGLASGTVVTALQMRDEAPADRLAYQAAPGNTALNVLDSFASSDAAAAGGTIR